MRGEVGSNIMIKLPMSLIKPLSFDWIIAAFNIITSPIVQKGFQLANISDIYINNNIYKMFPSNPSILLLPVAPQNLLALTPRKKKNNNSQLFTLPNSNSHLLPPPPPTSFTLPPPMQQPALSTNASQFPSSPLPLYRI